MVDVAPILGPFLARPPTPPRESSSKLSNDTAFLNGASITHSLLDTPDESPASSAEYFKESSGRARKKVGFSGWTQYHRASPVGGKGYDSDEHRKRVPPSRECNPTKSILKSHIDAVSAESKENVPAEPTNLPSMLRSAALHLAGNMRSSKIDAYISLLGCLSAYDDIPDPEELAEKVVEITRAIRRDIIAKNADGTEDAQLAAQALKLVTILLCTKGTADLLPDDFSSFIIEQSIICMEDPSSPKMLVSHHMHLLEKQKFSPKILTAERLNRLLSILGIITTRVKGNRVVCHRLNIYQRLLTQAKALMISRVGSWIDNLVSGMLSTIKDVRARAIAFGMEAGLQLGTVTSISQECINVFNRQSPEGAKVVDFLESRLMEMIKTKEDGLHVPQIWSVILLFFRSRPQQIERWEHLKLWLGILQQCFNSSNAQIKFQANIAWNRFIFSIDISKSTSISLARMLKQPIVSQLERKSTEKNAKLAKQIARSSYCTLLYYALRPAAPHAQLDQYWDLYIVELLPKAFSASQADIDYACDILVNLFFNNSQPKIWDANKANATGPMKPDDLATLDSKWLRSKTESIFEIFEKLFELAEWKDLENSPIVLAWQSFMSALGSASSKEVKVSMGTMTAVAKMVDCLKGFLVQRHPKSASSDNLTRFNILFKDAVAKMGPIPFNEKRLLFTQSNVCEAAAETPSSRGSSKSASLDSAAVHLLNLLLDVGDCPDPASRQIVLDTIVHVAVQNTSSRRNRLRALRNIARQLTFDQIPSQYEGLNGLWVSLAKHMVVALGLPRTAEMHDDTPEYSGHEYRDVVKILELGVLLHSKVAYEFWRKLFDCMCETIGEEVGNVGKALVVQEPLAEVLRAEILKQCDDTMVNSAVSLLESVQWPGNPNMIEHAQVQLWGVKPFQHRADPMESLKPCQLLMSTLLEAIYASVGSMAEDTINSALSAAILAIKAVPQGSRYHFINQAQKGIGLWIEDAGGAIVHRSDSFTKVQQLYETVIKALESAPKFDSSFLAQCQGLVISCLRSRHKPILNQSLLMWNRTFGAADSLQYSEGLRKVLLKLRDATDIQLPGFPDIGDGETPCSPLNFDDPSDSDEEVPRQVDATPNKGQLSEHRSQRFSTPLRFGTASPKPASTSKEASRPLSTRRNAKTTPQAKLRHDNSQIQFAAIESSPMAEENDEAQILTDRQKEVRERQQHEAALFPDIKSSPKAALTAANYRLPTLAFSSNEAQDKLQQDETTSPSFPPDALMNDFLGSSPTPSSSRKRSEEPYSDDGPPSSPPMISQTQIDQTMALPQHYREANGDQGLLENVDNADENMGEAVLMLPSLEAASDESRKTPADPKQDEPTARAHPDVVNHDLLSDIDIYVDAPTEPSNIISSDYSKHMDVTKDASRGLESSCAIAENDQVTAQLMGEIAKAFSQRSSPPSQDMQATGNTTKRRKPRPTDGPRKRKKADDVTAFGEVTADCVLIDARPSTDDLDTADPVDKEEQPAPPSQMDDPVTETRGDTPSVVGQSKQPGRGTGESDKPDGPPASLRRRVRVKAEDGVSRRSRRTTRTSSRLSDMGTGSPSRSEASVPSPEEAGSNSVPWISGPRGSRWAYVPATARTASQTILPAIAGTDSDQAATSQPATVRHAEPPSPVAGHATEAGDHSTASGILQGFEKMLESIKTVTLRPEEERAMVGVLFESVQQVHEAGRRHTTR